MAEFTNIPAPDIKREIDEHGVIFKTEPMKNYLAHTQFISAGKLHSIISTTPKQFLYEWQNPGEPTEATIIGSVLHSYTFDKSNFEKEFAVLIHDHLPHPENDFRNTANRAYRDRFIETAYLTGMTVITEEQEELVFGMHAALTEGNETSRKILNQKSIKEVSVYCKWDYNGKSYFVKIRPDFVSLRKPFYLDLKKTRNASPEPNHFPKDAFIYGYDIKCALYYDVLTKYWKQFSEFAGEPLEPLKRALIIAVEDTPPFNVAVYSLRKEGMDNDTVDIGRYRYNQAFGRFAECLEKKEWPGYELYAEEDTKGIVDLILPAWTNKEIII